MPQPDLGEQTNMAPCLWMPRGRGSDLLYQRWDDRCARMRLLHGILHTANVVVIPCLAERYGSRPSGVLTEVLSLGKPAIVPRDTWIGDQDSRGGGCSLMEKRLKIWPEQSRPLSRSSMT
jgi:hypothetical protein